MTSPLELGLFPALERELRPLRRGVLPYDEIKRLLEAEHLCADDPIQDAQIQPASLDLRLGEVAYQVRASFLPGKRRRVLESLDGLIIQQIPIGDGAILQKGAVYIVPLLESLQLPAHTFAKANPKSTTGRLDVFARLITDYSEQFDRVARGYRGPLYVEIAPKTFNIQVQRGTLLNQLRFLRGVPAQMDMSRKAANDVDKLVYDEHGEPMRASVTSGLWFSVDLKGTEERQVVGWKAINDAPAIDLSRVNFYEPADFWEPIYWAANRDLILQPGAFYILGSKERVRVPPSYAAEMVPYDPSVGEFRVHYAGFFDPGFGYGRGEVRGTRAILEVRTHDVPYALQDGQKIGRLIYERLLSPPTKLYGDEAGSSYQFQDVGLSKHFRPWAAGGRAPGG